MLERETALEALNLSKKPQFNFPQIISFESPFLLKYFIITSAANFQWKSKRLVVWLLLIVTLIHPSSPYLQFSPNQFCSYRQSESLFRVLQSNNGLGWSIKPINLLQAISHKAFNWIRGFYFLEFKFKIKGGARVLWSSALNAFVRSFPFSVKVCCSGVNFAFIGLLLELRDFHAT